VSRQVYRYTVPVDDQDHEIQVRGFGGPLKVGARQLDVVEFWAMANTELPLTTRVFRVFGTGQPVPDVYEYRGTPEPVAGGHLVWHLFERVAAARCGECDAVMSDEWHCNEHGALGGNHDGVTHPCDCEVTP
jgi:hypothetical protein